MSFEQKQYWLKGREYERERILKLLKNSPIIQAHIDWENSNLIAAIQDDTE